jgi:hypothetical protein
VRQGERIKLETKISGKPQPNVEWFKDDKKVKDDKRTQTTFDGQNCTLKILPTTLEDKGTYKCVATNEIGSVTLSTEVAVTKELKKPEFKEKIQPLLAKEGEEVRFDVRITGNPQPKVEWYKDRTPLKDERRFVLIDDEEEDLFSLIIEDVHKDDADMYKCVAINEAGKSTCTSELSVKEIIFAPEFVGEVEKAPVTVDEGDEVKLTVEVKGKPIPKVEWTKDDKPLKETRDLTLKKKDGEYTLVLSDAKQKDSGQYKCTAKNTQGTSTREFVVDVESKYCNCWWWW